MTEQAQVTVVTGGSRGIGAAVSTRLAEEGHRVAVVWTRDEAAAAATVGRIDEAGGTAVALRADVSSAEEVDALFDAATRELGPVTGLVNNAGVTGRLGRLTDTAPETMRRVWEVNVMGTLLCSRRAVQEMSTRHGGRGGAVVNISSAAATLGSPGEYVHYAGSKAAVDAITTGLSKELALEGVRVNSVQPGMIVTDMHAAMGDPERPWRRADRVPMGRPGRPEEVAGAVAWLLSEDAGYTTGAVLRVSGGL